ncbi:MAG TPA: hypothetical protein VMF64_04695 [Steroidobacteraceae bacterium]|nr:hypothetical protein [Steroidobacteraceae bacterium]
MRRPPAAPAWRELPRWLRALSILALVNFGAFVIGAEYLHGDALNGHVAAGHYFLSWHGTDTEVSRAVFTYSRDHAISMLCTHAAAIIGWLAWRWRVVS